MKTSSVHTLYFAIISKRDKKKTPWLKPFFLIAVVISWLSFLFIELVLWSSCISSLITILAVLIAGLFGLMMSSILTVVQVKQFRHTLQALMTVNWKCYEFLYIENKIKDSRLLQNSAFVFISGSYCRHLGLSNEASVLQNHAVMLNPHLDSVLFSGKQELSVADASVLTYEFTKELTICLGMTQCPLLHRILAGRRLFKGV
jgi:hypothetical protein